MIHSDFHPYKKKHNDSAKLLVAQGEGSICNYLDITFLVREMRKCMLADLIIVQ